MHVPWQCDYFPRKNRLSLAFGDQETRNPNHIPGYARERLHNSQRNRITILACIRACTIALKIIGSHSLCMPNLVAVGSHTKLVEAVPDKLQIQAQEQL